MSKIEVDEIVNQTGDNDSGIDLTTNDQIGFKIANASKWTLNSSGNLFPASTAQGIVFGATSDTASNRLDDYEEGTWTPSLNSSVSSNGNYTKIGRMVTLNGYIGSSDSSTSSAVIVTGLPFAVADLVNNTSHEAQGTISYHENAGGNYASAVVVRTGNEIDFRRSDTLTQLQYADNSGTWSIRFSVTYFTS